MILNKNLPKKKTVKKTENASVDGIVVLTLLDNNSSTLQKHKNQKLRFLQILIDKFQILLQTFKIYF